jgi:polyphosphate kinase
MIEKYDQEQAEALSPPPSMTGDQPRYLNRALSWLEFNRRVLDEALGERHPLLERVRFLSVFSSNLDHFFMVRVAALREQMEAGTRELSADGLLPEQQLDRLKPIVEELAERQHHCWRVDLLPKLRAAGVDVRDYDQLDAGERDAAAALFHDQIFPVLTPLAFDPGHPFPHISNLSLNLAIVIKLPSGEERFARLKVPEVLPRLVRLPGRPGVVVWIEQIIVAHIGSLFPGMEIVAVYPFRVTRDAGIELRDEEATDLLVAMQEDLRQRQFGQVIRLTVDESIPPRILTILRDNLGLRPEDVYRIEGTLGLIAVSELYEIERPDLKYAPLTPAIPRALANDAELFAAMREHDVLLHHPFESFSPVIELIRTAAEDQHVLAIKQTLYRVGPDTAVAGALIRARELGKQVTALIELKARFDEEHNIEWAQQLEDVGVHVVYGILGLKTHCKITLIVRKEHDGLRRYIHLSTGNYNPVTARQYTDIGLLTSADDFGADASDLFNYLTGYSTLRGYRAFAVAPATLRSRLLELIDAEVDRQQEGGGRIVLKLNTLTDQQIVEALYSASRAGVAIDLIVRSVCILRPGVPGLSENIRVRSIIGRFLEHSHIFMFGNGGEPNIYLCSGDLTTSNLDRQVELLWPIRQPDLRQRLQEALDTYLRDTANAYLLQGDGGWVRPPDDLPGFDSQAWLLERIASRTETQPRPATDKRATLQPSDPPIIQ